MTVNIIHLKNLILGNNIKTIFKCKIHKQFNYAIRNIKKYMFYDLLKHYRLLQIKTISEIYSKL